MENRAGAAMDLTVGAKQVLVTMEHRGRDGTPKILQQYTYPLTGKGVVSRIYPDLAVIDVMPIGLQVHAMKAGVSESFLRTVPARRCTSRKRRARSSWTVRACRATRKRRAPGARQRSYVSQPWPSYRPLRCAWT